MKIWTVKLDDELAAKIEEWRRKQPIIPSMSAALRYFIGIGIKKARS